jgi:methyl-accepting chemotaxis protein
MKLTQLFTGGLNKKTIKPVVIIIMVSMTCLTIFNYYSQVSILKSDAEETVNSALNTAQGFIESHLNLYQQMATLLANTPSVADAVRRDDRVRLTEEYNQAYGALKKRIQLNQFNFQRPPGVTLLRLQDPERFGDRIIDVRRTIADVYAKKVGIKGLEFGRTGLGLRGVEPIYLRGSFVGSVEFGGDLAPALEEAKRAFGIECGIVIAKSATTVAQVLPELQGTAKHIGDYLSFYSTDQNLTLGIITAGLLENGKKSASFPFISSGSFQNKNYSIGVSPLKDYSGNVIGYLYVMKDRTVVLGKIYKSLAINLIVFLVALSAIVFAISGSISKNVIEPVVYLSHVADEISKGKVGEKVEMKTGDEIETLAKSVDRLRVSMKMFLE